MWMDMFHKMIEVAVPYNPQVTPSADDLYWAMHRVDAPYSSSFTKASFKMLRESLSSVKAAGKEVWANRCITHRTILMAKQSGAFLICAVYCFFIGRFNPEKLVKLRHYFNLPRLSASFKLHNLFFTHNRYQIFSSTTKRLRDWAQPLLIEFLISPIVIGAFVGTMPLLREVSGLQYIAIRTGAAALILNTVTRIPIATKRIWNTFDI